jgi:hypothetical protein
MNVSAIVRHPNIGKFIDLLKKEESKTKLTVSNLLSGKLRCGKQNEKKYW